MVVTRVIGSKALQKQGRGVLLTLPVCVFLPGFGPDFFLTFYSMWFLPASSKPHLFGENRLMILLAITDFWIVTVSLSRRALKSNFLYVKKKYVGGGDLQHQHFLVRIVIFFGCLVPSLWELNNCLRILASFQRHVSSPYVCVNSAPPCNLKMWLGYAWKTRDPEGREK